MKVQGPSSSQAAVGARKAGGAAVSGFVLPGLETGAAAPARQAAPASTLANIGTLLALQGDDDLTERRERAKRRGHQLLDLLEDIRMATLGDGVSRTQVAALSQALREHRDAVDDPALNALLDDVELRAEVELAKLERAL